MGDLLSYLDNLLVALKSKKKYVNMFINSAVLWSQDMENLK